MHHILNVFKSIALWIVGIIISIFSPVMWLFGYETELTVRKVCEE